MVNFSLSKKSQPPLLELTSNQNRLSNLNEPPELAARDMIPRPSRPRGQQQRDGCPDPRHLGLHQQPNAPLPGSCRGPAPCSRFPSTPQSSQPFFSSSHFESQWINPKTNRSMRNAIPKVEKGKKRRSASSTLDKPQAPQPLSPRRLQTWPATLQSLVGCPSVPRPLRPVSDGN